ERPRSRTLSNMLHVLRLYGPHHGEIMPPAAHAEPWLEVLLDHDRSRARFQGQATLIDTRDGIRCREVERDAGRGQPERQSHPDQLLAVLGELGVPLDRPVSTAGGARTVAALLADSLANFDLDKREPEWTALAYALYLPPRKQWTDKFGR